MERSSKRPSTYGHIACSLLKKPVGVLDVVTSWLSRLLGDVAALCKHHFKQQVSPSITGRQAANWESNTGKGENPLSGFVSHSWWVPHTPPWGRTRLQAPTDTSVTKCRMEYVLWVPSQTSREIKFGKIYLALQWKCLLKPEEGYLKKKSHRSSGEEIQNYVN